MKFCAENSRCKGDKYGDAIVYTYHDSDTFYDASLCKYNSNCMCFKTEEPIKTGENIYIMTHEYPLDGQSLEIYEGCLAKVEWCSHINKIGDSAFLIGVGISK